MRHRLGRGRAWRCRSGSTLCFCAGWALPTGTRIGDGLAITVSADVGRAPSHKATPPSRAALPADKTAFRRKNGEQGLPRKIVVPRMGMRHGRLGELPCQAPQEARRGVRSVPRRGGEVDVLQYRRDAPLRECDLFEVRVAASVVDPPHGISSSPRVRLIRQPCCDGWERLMAMRCGDSPCKCQECGAGVGTPLIVESVARVPRSDPLWMVVGSVALAGASRACSEVGTRRFREASAAPDPEGKKIRLFRISSG